MENPQLFYAIPKHLNKGKTIVGLPQDEVLPALIVFTLLFMARHQAIAFTLAAIWFMGLRTIKTQYGENILQLVIYWWGASWVNQTFFKRTPSSNRRYWIY